MTPSVNGSRYLLSCAARRTDAAARRGAEFNRGGADRRRPGFFLAAKESFSANGFRGEVQVGGFSPISAAQCFIG
jgi:hypothetical protein